MADDKMPLYTPDRYLKWGSVHTWSGDALPTEWLTVIPERLGFKNLKAMQDWFGTIRTEPCSPTLQEKLHSLFQAYFDQEQFSEPIAVVLDDGTSLRIPNPFAVVGNPVISHNVGQLHLSKSRECVTMAVKHASICIDRALRPATPALQPICDWLASESPLSETISVDALRFWLEENSQPPNLAEREDFHEAVARGMERALEDSMHFNLADDLFEMAETYVEDGEGGFSIRKEADKVGA